MIDSKIRSIIKKREDDGEDLSAEDIEQIISDSEVERSDDE